MKSCELSKAIQNLPPDLREKILKEYIEIKIKEKKEMGWMDIHEEIENLPYCEIQGQLTKVFLCIKCNNCDVAGKCVACHENEKKCHTLVDREEVWELEEKGFARIWGAPKLISESPQEIKEREEDIRTITLQRSVDKLCKEYLEMKAEKKKGKRGNVE